MQVLRQNCHAAHPTACRPRPRRVNPHPRPSLNLHSISQEAASSTTTAALPVQQQVAAGPQASYPEQWQQCVQHIQNLGFDEQQADTFVQRAFGWGRKARAYWRHEKNEQQPDLQQVIAVLTFLQQLGMTEYQISKTIQGFPEVLGCAVDSQLQGNVQKLQKEWRLQGDVLLKAVLRNPALLGYNVDCLGDCVGECNRCWARF